MNFEFSFWITLILIAVIMAVIMGTCAYLILAERKISAWAQDRLGPNRVGWYGVLQPIADGIKFLLKEQVVPDHVDKLFYFLGPAIAVSTALLAIAVVPFGRTTPPPVLLDRRPADPKMAAYSETPRGPIWPATQSEKNAVLAADEAWAKATGGKSFEKQMEEYNETIQFVITPHADIGVVFVFAIGSLAVYAIVLGGWSSNNKYSLLGSLRSSAQLISYEIPMGMSVLGVMLVTGSLNLERMVAYQAEHGWNVLFQPLACLLFVTSIFAECNRVPFDLPEAEQELVGGYHTEYSGMKFALYFLGEYTHMITTSFLAVALFFGGGHLPFVNGANLGDLGDTIVALVVFGGKMVLFIIFYMLIRWTIPRFRFDQLMGLAWKVMMPLALLSLVMVLFVKYYQPLGEYSRWLLLPGSLVILLGAALVSLRMPRGPTRGSMTVQGHPVSGALVTR
jgi:NADH-quinone oxidoreductase subunit H